MVGDKKYFTHTEDITSEMVVAKVLGITGSMVPQSLSQKPRSIVLSSSPPGLVFAKRMP
jgi:hypothetical protein